MKYTPTEKLHVLAKLPQGRRHAIECLWGIGEEFYAYLFQSFKYAVKEKKDREYALLKGAFPEEAEAFEAQERRELMPQVAKLVEELRGAGK